jgi:hypothetical protein
VPRCLELAAEESARILNITQAVEQFLCGVLRGEGKSWPSAADTNFYSSFLERTHHHGVDALVCHVLKPTDAWNELPDVLKDELLQRSRGAIAIEMARSRDLNSLHEALEQAGLSALLLKGSALAYTHYPDPHLRTRVDTDIFIDSGDIRQVRDTLPGLGYQLRGWAYKSHQFNAVKEDFGGGIIKYDVHWRSNNCSTYARVIGYQEAEKESIPVPGLNGWRTLNPVHTLLLACMHRAGSSRHDPDRLIWLYDVHLLVSSMSEQELLSFSARAVSENIQAVCYQAIEKSRRCFATQVPGQVLQILLSPSGPKSIGRRFSNSQLALIFDDLRQMPDLRSKLALLREFLMPPGEYLLGRYGKEGWYWIPPLYFRYLLGGIIERVSLR